MVNTTGFKQWLSENTAYSHDVINDVVSRIRRADSLLEIYNDEIYLFYLGKQENFKELSASVRSQVKKAVKLYLDFQQTQKG